MALLPRRPFLLPLVLGAVAVLLLALGAQNVAGLDAPQPGLGLKHPLVVGAALALGAFHLGLSALLRRDTPAFHLGMLPVHLAVSFLLDGVHPQLGVGVGGGLAALCIYLALSAWRRGPLTR